MNLYDYLNKWFEDAVTVNVDVNRSFVFTVKYGNKNEVLKVDLGDDIGSNYLDKEMTDILRAQGGRLKSQGVILVSEKSAFISNENVDVFLSNVLETLEKAYPNKLAPTQKNKRQYSMDTSNLGNYPLLIDHELEFVLKADNESQTYSLGISDRRAKKSKQVFELLGGKSENEGV